jgi:hypothetical protein
MPIQTRTTVRTEIDFVLSKLLQPDVLLPEQYLGIYRRKTTLQTEKALMFAVLNDAVDPLRRFAGSQSRRRRALYHSARDWVRREEDLWLFSFNNICDVLGLDSQFLRQGLLDWRLTYPGRGVSKG